MIWWTIQKLRSSKWEIRADAARRLGASGRKQGVPALLRALNDENTEVRLAVIRALALLRHPASAGPLAASLAGIARRPKPKPTVTDPVPQGVEYEALAATLGSLGSAAVGSLLPLLDSEDRDTRRWAAHALGLARDPKALEPLSARLDDNRSEVRKAAALALGSLGDMRAAVPLTRCLANRDSETRRAAAVALGALGSPDSVDALCSLLEDANEPVQLAVVQALGIIGGVRAAIGLRAAADGGKKNVRETALTALRSLSFAPADAQERAVVNVLTDDFAAAAREGEAAVGAIAATLNTKDARRRRLAAEALASIPSAASVQALLKGLHDHDLAVQEAAAGSLIRIGPAAFAGLTTLLDDLDPTVQKLAIRSLAGLADARAVGVLAAFLEANRTSVAGYPELVDVLQITVNALGDLLERFSDVISVPELERIRAIPDVEDRNVAEDGPEPIVDCTPIREKAHRVMQRRLE